MCHKGRRVLRIVLFGAVLLAILAAAAVLQWKSQLNLAPIDLQLGQTVFQENCALCHVRSAEGRPPAPPLNSVGHAHHHPDWELYMTIAEGKVGFGEMPSWKNRLSNREIWSVIAYIKTLWDPDQQRFQDRINQLRPAPP